MKEKLYRVSAMLSLRGGMSVTATEYDIIGGGDLTFSVMTKLNEKRRIRKEDLMTIDTKVNNGPTRIAFFTWCMPNDVVAAKALAQNAVSSYLSSMESNIKTMRTHCVEFVRNK